MMGRQTSDQSQLFYLFNLERRVPASHLLRHINPVVTRVLAELRAKLEPFYSDIGRPSIDPELMLRMLIVGYCYGIRFERRLAVSRFMSRSPGENFDSERETPVPPNGANETRALQRSSVTEEFVSALQCVFLEVAQNADLCGEIRQSK